MKKIMLTFVVFALMFSVVSAVGNDNSVSYRELSQNNEQIQEQLRVNEQVMVQNSFGNFSYFTNDTNKLQLMSQSMEQLSIKEQTQLKKMVDASVSNVDNKLIVEGKEDAKLFGFITMKRNNSYEITDKGLIKQQNMWDFLWGNA